MGCEKLGHRHRWPTSGTLIIQRCETRCNFCEGPAAKKKWKYAWFLRRHVRSVHVNKGQYPNLIVPLDWDEGKVRGSAKARAAERQIKQEETEEPVLYVDQPRYEDQMANEQMFAPGFAPQYAVDPDLSLEGRLIDPSKLGEGGMRYEDNADGYYPAFANEAPAATSQYWSADNLDDFFLMNTATPLEKAQAAAQAQADDDAEQDEEIGPIANENTLLTMTLPDRSVKNEEVRNEEQDDDDYAADDEGDTIAVAGPKPMRVFPYPPTEENEGDEPPYSPIDPNVYIGKVESEDPTETKAGQQFFFADYEPADLIKDEEIDIKDDAFAPIKEEEVDINNFYMNWADYYENAPIADIFGLYHQVKPSAGDASRMVGLLDTVVDVLEAQGMDLDLMMPCVEMFARRLSNRAEKELKYNPAAENFFQVRGEPTSNPYLA